MKTVPQLLAYWANMNHAKERLAVMSEQLVEFIDALTYDQPAHLEIERDGGVYYIRLRG